MTAAALLELHAAASAAVQLLPRKARHTRLRLERAVILITREAHAELLVLQERPTRDAALEQFRLVLVATRKAGVDWRDVVAAVNGDDER